MDSPPSRWQVLRQKYKKEDETVPHYSLDKEECFTSRSEYGFKHEKSYLTRPTQMNISVRPTNTISSSIERWRGADLDETKSQAASNNFSNFSVENVLNQLRETKLSIESEEEWLSDGDLIEDCDLNQELFGHRDASSISAKEQAEVSSWVSAIKTRYASCTDSENKLSMGNRPTAEQAGSEAPLQKGDRECSNDRVLRGRNLSLENTKQSDSNSDRLIKLKERKQDRNKSAQPVKSALFAWEVQSFKEIQAEKFQEKIVKVCSPVVKKERKSKDLELREIRLQARMELKSLRLSFDRIKLWALRQAAIREERHLVILEASRTRKEKRLVENGFKELRLHYLTRKRQRRLEELRKRMTQWRSFTDYHRNERALELKRQRDLHQERQKNERAAQFRQKKLVLAAWKIWRFHIQLFKIDQLNRQEENQRKASISQFLNRLEASKSMKNSAKREWSVGQMHSLEQNDARNCIEDQPSFCTLKGSHEKAKLNEVSKRIQSKRTPSFRESKINSFKEKSSKQENMTPSLKLPSDLEKMEKRAIERREKREELRRQQLELTQMRLVEQEQRELENEMVIVEERKRQRKVRREEQKRILQAKKIEDEKQQLSTLHRNKAILWYRGLKPWLLFVKISRWNHHVAEAFHFATLQKKCFSGWVQFHGAVQRVRKQRELAMDRAANNFRRRSLLRLGWNIVKTRHYRLHARFLAIQAQHNYFQMKQSVFKWRCALAARLKVFEEAKRKLIAQKLGRIWAAWKSLVDQTRTFEIASAEKRRMWSKVRGWLDEF